MVAIHCPSNAILIRPFASKHDTHQIAAYQDIYQRLAVHGAVPTLHILDNEISMAFQHAITTNSDAPSSSFHCTFINETLPNGPSIHSRIIFSPSLLALLPRSPKTVGTCFFCRRN